MPPGDEVEFELSLIDAAVEQLDWAMRLFLDHQAFIPAITLAGAAEELLGKAVGDRTVHGPLKKKLASDYSMPEGAIVKDHLNKARNLLKHGDSRLPATKKVCLELEEEALQLIARALTNLSSYDFTQPPHGPRFWTWMSENRRD
jgi:hypothetical protein